MSTGRRSVIGRLKQAVNKIKILLDLTVNKWKLAPIIGSLSSKRRLSLPIRRGLTAVFEDMESVEEPELAVSLQRTISFQSEDDVDKRADVFIANFYKQLQLERQVSLELRYLRSNSFNSQLSP